MCQEHFDGVFCAGHRQSTSLFGTNPSTGGNEGICVQSKNAMTQKLWKSMFDLCLLFPIIIHYSSGPH